jgi:hypothetical protein
MAGPRMSTISMRLLDEGGEAARGGKGLLREREWRTLLEAVPVCPDEAFRG